MAEILSSLTGLGTFTQRLPNLGGPNE